MSAKHDQHYLDAQAALRKALENYDHCSAKEKTALVEEFVGLQEMAKKLESGTVDIVLFGEINTGKSALINAVVGRPVAAVSVEGGKTRDAKRWSWDGCSYRVPGYADSRVNLIDTPGINEVDGAERARIAAEVAHRADLILFLTDSDLNDLEHKAFLELAATHRPMLLVFNQVDKYSPPNRQRLIEVFQERLAGVITREDIVETAADPKEREVIHTRDDGTEHSEWRKPPVQVAALKERILSVLHREGKALLALNAAMFAADKSDRIATVRVRMRDDQATRVVWSYAVTKGIGLAANPIPVLDILGGTAIDVGMVVHLSRIYGIQFTKAKAVELVATVVAAAGVMIGVEWTTHAAAALTKGLSFGVSTVVTALPQAVIGAFGSYVVGQAAKQYFQHGASWGEGGAKEVVRRIMAGIDRESVLTKLRDDILAKLSGNRYAAGPS